MKICFLTATPFLMGGIQRVVLTLANELAKKNEVTITYTFKPDDGSICYPIDNRIKLDYCTEFHDGSGKYKLQKVIRKFNENVVSFNSIELLKNIYYPRNMQTALIRYIKENRFDVVIGCAGKYSLLLGIVAPELDCTCIGWEHNSFDAYFITKGQNSLWRQDKLFESFIPNLKTCVVLSDRDVVDYEKRLNIKARRIYNPICIKNCRNEKRDTKTVLFVGRLEYEQKGLHYLAEIINSFLKRHEDWKFEIVGDGSGKEYLLSEIDNNVAGRVDFAGQQNNVENYYINADIFVLTSKWEGFGLVAVEAMSFGLPVVSFKTAGPSEIIKDGINGRLIDCYNVDEFVAAIDEMDQDKEFLSKLSLEAQKRSNDFRVETIMQEWKRVLFDL